jgi:hypothetical protein
MRPLAISAHRQTNSTANFPPTSAKLSPALWIKPTALMLLLIMLDPTT